jgi:hypothetical protein
VHDPRVVHGLHLDKRIGEPEACPGATIERFVGNTDDGADYSLSFQYCCG